MQLAKYKIGCMCARIGHSAALPIISPSNAGGASNKFKGGSTSQLFTYFQIKWLAVREQHAIALGYQNAN